MATSLAEVRTDHRLRYQAACKWLQDNQAITHVLDAGCGVGYGSALLADVAHHVTAVDTSPEAKSYYEKYFFRDNINYLTENIFEANLVGPFDAVVSFEFLEHIKEADRAIELFGRLTDVLICSTPNEIVRPHKKEPINPFHIRHYTPEEFESLIGVGGFKVVARFNQAGGAAPDIRPGWNGKFMIAVGVK